MSLTLTRALAAKREARPDTTIARYRAALASHAAAGIETARNAAAARARGDHLMAAAMVAIHANLAPVHPVTKAAALARGMSREAWKLRAGLIEAREGAADDWCDRLKADASRHLQFARDLRFELAAMPVEFPHVGLNTRVAA